MRELVKEFVKIVAETLPVGEPIYEFGSLQVPGQEGFADLRPLFEGKEYIGCDLQEGPGVDRVLDLHNIELSAGTAGTALVLDTLEHVEFARRAVEELERILKIDGILVISSVMKFPIHSYPCDYWRFTPEGFRSLLRVFDSSFVDFAGDGLFPHTVVGIGFKGAVSVEQMHEFSARIEGWKKRWRRPPGKIRKCLTKLVTRPREINLYKRILKR